MDRVLKAKLTDENENLRALLKSNKEAFEIILLDTGIRRTTATICKKEINKIRFALR